jgi:hypothetical protein
MSRHSTRQRIAEQASRVANVFMLNTQAQEEIYLAMVASDNQSSVLIDVVAMLLDRCQSFDEERAKSMKLNYNLSSDVRVASRNESRTSITHRRCHSSSVLTKRKSSIKSSPGENTSFNSNKWETSSVNSNKQHIIAGDEVIDEDGYSSYSDYDDDEEEEVDTSQIRGRDVEQEGSPDSPKNSPSQKKTLRTSKDFNHMPQFVEAVQWKPKSSPKYEQHQNLKNKY